MSGGNQAAPPLRARPASCAHRRSAPLRARMPPAARRASYIYAPGARGGAGHLNERPIEGRRRTQASGPHLNGGRRWRSGPPTHSAPGGRWGSERDAGRGGPYASWAERGLLEEREGSSHPLLSPPTSQGGRPSSWSGPHLLSPALASPVSLPLELVEGLTCPDSSAGRLQRMWSWQPQGPSWVLCPLRPGDGSEVPPTCCLPHQPGRSARPQG